MLETLKAIDENWFLFVNSHHNLFFDKVMWFFSQTISWGFLYLWFLWLLYKQFPKKYWTILLAIILMIVLSDQFCNVVKDQVMRLRPSHEPHLQYIIHLVNGYQGGMYGFYSAHASNSFALAFFVIFSLLKERKYIILIALTYSILTSYSRIYLGVHYPGDILTGALAGAVIGSGVAYFHMRLRLKFLSDQS